MGWVRRKVNEHQCKKPQWDSGIHEGDIWECDVCKTRYEITHIEFEDRPAGAVWITWVDIRSLYG